ncbi:HAMP domain-containing histidine kinase [Candidatus Saccharibacteria bacterium]|nr:HAMP domain-containing histidine kinase [Candidatus Saccharibacteria bacterium]
MFRKLRNHFILINLATTSFILIAAFSSIYIVAKNSSDTRRPIPIEINFEESTDKQEIKFRQIMEERIIADREVSLKSLLVTLIIIGVAVEIVVAIFSYLFAEQAIKPVKTAYETQKIFIANASHEIKTPVAAIKANLEAADLSEENHWIKNIEIEADKIETLNLALLRLAKTDAVQETLFVEEFDLKRTTSGIVSSFSSRIKQKGIKLKNNAVSKKIKLNRSDFKEIFEILLDNAIKYCDKSIDITVTSKTLTITNDGTTIPNDKISHVFDRFYQVDKTSSGSGLGLAIADSLAKRNNWQLTAKSNNNSTTFELYFA